MRSFVDYSVHYTRADEFAEWLDNEGIDYDRTESGAFDVFSCFVDEDEEENIYFFLNDSWEEV